MIFEFMSSGFQTKAKKHSRSNVCASRGQNKLDYYAEAQPNVTISNGSTFQESESRENLFFFAEPRKRLAKQKTL